MVLFVFAVGYGNRHPWYQLPFVPIAAAFGGLAMQEMAARRPNESAIASPIRFTVAALVLLAFAGMSCLALREMCEPAAADLRAAGLRLQAITPPNALVVAADYGEPTVFYYGQRKGWHFTERDGIYNGHPESSTQAIADFEELRRQGATHFVFYSGSLWWLDYYADFRDHLQSSAILAESTPQFKIFELKR
jgi:hypothetical protein